ncbi:uncharacterized protein [Periplaneta americana]|uniref:uncharacterized protein n=1 Tax=Periplaneta americana TaxID=6978 RepID=UPI0037E7218E
MCKKMQRRIVMTLVATCAATTMAVGVDMRDEGCETDHECRVKGMHDYYCYIRTRNCVRCTNCTLYHRRKAPFPSCAKSAQDCGECMLGFEDEILTDGKKKDLCKAINVIPTPTPVIEEWKISTIAIIVSTFVVLTCAGYFFYRKCWKKDPGRNNDEESHHNNTHIPVEHAPPPPYTPLLPEPSAPIRAMSLENVINYQEEKDTEVQQAVCFKDADYPYNSGSLEQEDDSEDNTPALEDENTMESNWSPPIGYGQEVVNVPCTINEVTESSSEPAETRPPSPSNTQDDSGVSNSSALSLPHRPFEGLGSSDSTSSSSLPVQPLVPTTTTTRPRSWSDEEVNASSSSKRARHDSGTQSLENSGQINIVINVQHNVNMQQNINN